MFKVFFEKLNKGNIDIMNEVYAPNYAEYNPSANKPRSLEVYIEEMKMILRAFPDSNTDIKDIIAKGDKVIVRSIITATHKGDFPGRPATGI